MIPDILKQAKEVEADVISWRRDLHQIPELQLDLPQTTAYVEKVLTELGLKVQKYVNGNALVAVIEGTKPGNNKAIGLRADMDALPLAEETGLPFASKNGRMHACGHDGHTAMLLGTAKLLLANRENFSGRVVLLFQPGEELPGGAKPMIDEGVLRDNPVDYLCGVHEGNLGGTATSGSIIWSDGPMMASMDRFLIEVKGKGSHGAYPELSQDPVVAIGELISSIQTIKTRNIKATDPTVVSICRVTSGTSQNIVPERGELEGTVRTFNNEVRQKIARRLDEICRGISLAMNVDAKLTYEFLYPPLINNKDFTLKAVEALKEIFPAELLIRQPDPSMGGEDVAFFLQEVPGSFFFLHNPKPIDGIVYGHHNPRFDVDESYFHAGVALFTQIVSTFLN